MIAHSLRADGFDASEDGTGRGTPLIPIAYSAMPMNSGKDFVVRDTDGHSQAIAFSCKDHGADAGAIAPTLRSMGHNNSHANAGGQLAVAFDITGSDPTVRSGGAETDVHTSLRARSPGGSEGSTTTVVAQNWAVRRLTPTECERLQGFPDNYTNVPWRGKAGAPDGPRYKALGNSMACNCMRWIGMRIQLVSDAVDEAS